MRSKRCAGPGAAVSLLTAALRACCAAVLCAALPAAAADLDDVQRRGVLRHLGIPYAGFVTGSGDGMDVEIVQRFAEHLGVRYEYIRTDWDAVIGDLTGARTRPKGDGVEVFGAVPVRGDIIANGMTVLPWRSAAVDFSLPTFPTQVWIVARADSPVAPIKPSGSIDRDIAQVKKLLPGKTILGKAGTCLEPSLYGITNRECAITLFSGSLNELAPALLNGEAELALLDVPDAMIALQKWPGSIKVIGPLSEVQDMAAAFRKDAPRLRAAFNAFLKKIRRDGTYLAIVKKYYPTAIDYFPEFFRKTTEAESRR